MMFQKPRILLIYLITWRLISVYIVQTSHVPDEYWQSLEVAHHLTFDYGYLTWEWKSMIRSYIYPFFISILYRILKIFNSDSTAMLITIPPIFQAILSGYADYRFYLWTKSKWAVFCLAINWYWYYCATRTLTNTLETALTIVALSVFPWNKNKKTSINLNFLWILGFVCAIRPTMIIPWIPLCIYHIFSSKKSFSYLFYEYLVIGLATITYSTLIDTYCYGQLIFTPFEFFRFNIINNISVFYGKQHFLWYLINGLPVITGIFSIYLPFITYRILKNFRHLVRQAVCLISIIWTVMIYSLLGHKEFRFLLPILPMIIYICTCTPLPNKITMPRLLRKLLVIVFILSNFLPGIYFSLIHQRGPLDTMKFLENKLTIDNSTQTDIMFLTPCHAMPLYSHLHKNITIRFLTCEPNLINQENYVDEAEQFFQNPSSWLKQNYIIKNSSLPNIVIVYDNIVTKILEFLNNYRPIAKLFNSHFPQSNYGKYIVIYEKIK